MRKRALVSWGALTAAAALTTAAAVTDDETTDVRLARAAAFDIVAAGSAAPGWSPGVEDWVQANPDAYRVRLTPDGSTALVGPGGHLRLRIAARNASAEAAADVALRITDPDDERGATAPDGRYAELFDRLRVTVAEHGTVLVDDVPGTTLPTLITAWDAPWAPGEVHVLDVTLSVPAGLDNRWQGATTDLLFHFDAENA